MSAERSVLNEMELPTMVAIWGYDLRGTEDGVLEFAAKIAEGNTYDERAWDTNGVRPGIRWHDTQQLLIPEWWSLPWVSEALMPWGAWSVHGWGSWPVAATIHALCDEVERLRAATHEALAHLPFSAYREDLP